MVEIADSEENIQKLLPWLDEVLEGGLITMERARVIRYAGKDPGTAPEDGR